MSYLAQSTIFHGLLSDSKKASEFGNVIAPRLAKNRLLGRAFQTFSNRESAFFSPLLEEYFLFKHEQKEFDDDYVRSVEVIRRSPNPNLADALFEDLLKVPPAVQNPADRDAYLDDNVLRRLFRGHQGQIAMTLLEMDSPQIRTKYHRLIQDSSEELRAVLLWALGRSPSLIDYRLLERIYASTSSELEKDALLKSINAFPLNLERRAGELSLSLSENDTTGQEKVLSLKAMALELKHELQSKNMIVVCRHYD